MASDSSPNDKSTDAQQLDGHAPISKKAAKKDAKKAERLLNRQMAAATVTYEDDPLAPNYGDVPLENLQSKEISGRVWTPVSQLGKDLRDQAVLIRGRCHSVRSKGKLAFLVIREAGYTIQCVFQVQEQVVSKGMIKFVSSLSKESIVDVEGIVDVPNSSVTGTSQQLWKFYKVPKKPRFVAAACKTTLTDVSKWLSYCFKAILPSVHELWRDLLREVEIKGQKVYCVSKALPSLPFSLEDATRSEKDFQRAKEQEDLQYVRVNQDTRLNFRVLDLRTPANQGIFRIQSWIGMLFRQFLVSHGFIEIHTPKLIAGASEGGASVFKLDYKGQPACLAQSPQLHKQMAICGDFGKVFEIGPVFRAENSSTHRHLCEFTGLDIEMEIKEHYFEVLDLLDVMFVSIFDGLNENCMKELEAINEQYPFEPLKYLRKTLRLTFEEGLQLLKEDGVEIDPFGDLDTESERKLGSLVRKKYETDFYILHRYPLAVRPFYTMPCQDDLRYSNSFDVFIRGEEIISGAQRVHEPELLVTRAKACGIDVATCSTYIESFRWGAVPHGGIGVGLERVVMLFCALNNIRKTSMFPRDPTRLAP